MKGGRRGKEREGGRYQGKHEGRIGKDDKGREKREGKVRCGEGEHGIKDWRRRKRKK